MIKVAVCSENSMILDQVHKAADRILGTGGCDEYRELKNLLLVPKDEWRYMAVFLDICWDKEAKGIHAAEKIFRAEPETRIIYMTAYPKQYIQQIFLKPANVGGFLIKPIEEKFLEENLHKVKETAQEKVLDSLLVRYKNTVQLIRFDEILYLESSGHMVTIHTRTADYNCYGPLEKIYERLPEYFIQCHKSYVVNMREICRMDKRQITIENNTVIPISKARHRTTKNRYDCYMEQLLLSL